MGKQERALDSVQVAASAARKKTLFSTTLSSLTDVSPIVMDAYAALVFLRICTNDGGCVNMHAAGASRVPHFHASSPPSPSHDAHRLVDPSAICASNRLKHPGSASVVPQSLGVIPPALHASHRRRVRSCGPCAGIKSTVMSNERTQHDLASRVPQVAAEPCPCLQPAHRVKRFPVTRLISFVSFPPLVFS
jgi:hypothetical protein